MCHVRPRAGHRRLVLGDTLKTLMPGTRPGMTLLGSTHMLQRDGAIIVFWKRSCHFCDWSSITLESMSCNGPLVKGESTLRLGDTKLRLASSGCASLIRKS